MNIKCIVVELFLEVMWKEEGKGLIQNRVGEGVIRNRVGRRG